MNLIILAVITLVVGNVAWPIKFGGRLPVPYRNRVCQGKDWRRAYPAVPKHEIREFLEIFVFAFTFSTSEKLKLNPDDKILDIYRTVYPSEWQPDGLELEALAIKLHKKYAVELDSLWNDGLTLDELFASVLRTKPSRSS